MQPNPLVPGVPHSPAFLWRGPFMLVQETLGERSILDEGTQPSPHPAATERAETVFEMTGLFLVFLIALAAAWILIRGRL